ncbi:class II aldolase/adducin family protein [Alloyangia pacifica]|uniref:class II aldolase/adducin family protein n=1 Tax=Alloyangia pacifica TaxID=311180 RepID=UPI001CFCFFA1
MHYLLPGDLAIHNTIQGLSDKRWAGMLANHGAVAAGENLEAAVRAIEELEAGPDGKS